MSKNYFRYEVEIVPPSKLDDWLDIAGPGGSIEGVWKPFAITSDGDFCIRRIVHVKGEKV